MARSRSTLQSSLSRITRRAVDGVADVNERSAKRIEATAKQLVPVLSGDLRDSITAIPTEGSDWAVIARFPGHLIEFGTVHGGVHPFMVPAAESERPAHLAAVRGLYT